MKLDLIPTICALCKEVVPFNSTRIEEQPILRCNEDGSANPVYAGVATVAEVRICKTH